MFLAQHRAFGPLYLAQTTSRKVKPEMGTLKILKGISRLDLVPNFDLFVGILHRKLTDCGSLAWVFVPLLLTCWPSDGTERPSWDGGHSTVSSLQVVLTWNPLGRVGLRGSDLLIGKRWSHRQARFAVWHPPRASVHMGPRARIGVCNRDLETCPPLPSVHRFTEEVVKWLNPDLWPWTCIKPMS